MWNFCKNVTIITTSLNMSKEFIFMIVSIIISSSIDLSKIRFRSVSTPKCVHYSFYNSTSRRKSHAFQYLVSLRYGVCVCACENH